MDGPPWLSRMKVGHRLATFTMFVVVLCGAACSGDDDAPDIGADGEGITTTTPTTTTSSQAAVGGSGDALGDLDLRLELDDTTLAPGESTSGRIIIDNNTTNTIVDPHCALVGIDFGLVPADQPDAPLSGSVEVECEPGGRSIAPGVALRSDASAAFSAFEPGDYLAIVRHHDDGSAPLIVPVTVTSD